MKPALYAVIAAIALLPVAVFSAEEKETPQPAPAPAPAPAPIRVDASDQTALRAAMGKLVTATGRVTRANAWSGGITFINLRGGLTVVVFKKNLGNFTEPPDKMCDRRTIEVTGTVTEHKGKLQIEISKPEQIKVLPDPEPEPKPEPPATPEEKPNKPNKPTTDDE